MNDHAREDALTSLLEEARSQLETALQLDAHWRALAQASLPANRAAHERALADKPVYHAWKLLGRAIGHLRAAQDADSAAPSARSPTARQPRGGLREVLERVRFEPPPDTGEPQAGATAAAEDGPSLLRARPAVAPEDIEEAAVSFVVREPAADALEVAPPPATSAAELRGTEATPGETRGGSGHEVDASESADGDDEDIAEAEVRIVKRGS